MGAATTTAGAARVLGGRAAGFAVGRGRHATGEALGGPGRATRSTLAAATPTIGKTGPPRVLTSGACGVAAAAPLAGEGVRAGGRDAAAAATRDQHPRRKTTAQTLRASAHADIRGTAATATRLASTATRRAAGAAAIETAGTPEYVRAALATDEHLQNVARTHRESRLSLTATPTIADVPIAALRAERLHRHRPHPGGHGKSVFPDGRVRA